MRTILQLDRRRSPLCSHIAAAPIGEIGKKDDRPYCDYADVCPRYDIEDVSSSDGEYASTEHDDAEFRQAQCDDGEKLEGVFDL